FFLRSVSRRASLATVVVLPAPCRPAISTTAGGVAARFSSLLAVPITAVSSSLTTFTSAWPGDKLFITSWPTARTFTRWISACTTGNATSASSNAMRTSRKASRMFSSVSRPRPRRRLTVLDRRWLSDSNMAGHRYERTGDYNRARSARRLRLHPGRNVGDHLRIHVGRRLVIGHRLRLARRHEQVAEAGIQVEVRLRPPRQRPLPAREIQRGRHLEIAAALQDQHRHRELFRHFHLMDLVQAQPVALRHATERTHGRMPW